MGGITRGSVVSSVCGYRKHKVELHRFTEVAPLSNRKCSLMALQAAGQLRFLFPRRSSHSMYPCSQNLRGLVVERIHLMGISMVARDTHVLGCVDCRPSSLASVKGYLIRCMVRIVVTSLATQVIDATWGAFDIPTGTKSCTTHECLLPTTVEHSIVVSEINRVSFRNYCYSTLLEDCCPVLYILLTNGSTTAVEFNINKFFLCGVVWSLVSCRVV